MVRERVETAAEWLKRVVTKPRSELTRWQAAVRYGYDLFRYGAKQLHEDRASQMAAALTFRTLFAIFPMAVVTTVIFKGLKGTEHFESLVGGVIEASGLASVQVTPVDGVEVAGEETISLGIWLQQLIAQAAQIDLGTLGWVGFAVLIYAAIAMMVTIEEACNVVYRAPQGRSWLRRVPVYWTVLTISPAAVGLLLYLDAQVAQWFTTVDLWPWLLNVFRMFWSIGILWLLLFCIYVLVPNTQVAWRAAAAGSFIAALGVLIGKEILGEYVARFLSFRYLFGSLGFVPVFMFWLYLMWHVALFGLEVSATLQMVGGRRIDELERKASQHAVFDPSSVVVVMEVIAEHFTQGRRCNLRHISQATGIPESTIAQMVEPLLKAGLVHRLDGDENGLTLAKPPDTITAAELLDIGFNLTAGYDRSAQSSLVRQLRRVQQDEAAKSTLASIVAARLDLTGGEDQDSRANGR